MFLAARRVLVRGSLNKAVKPVLKNNARAFSVLRGNSLPAIANIKNELVEILNAKGFEKFRLKNKDSDSKKTGGGGGPSGNNDDDDEPKAPNGAAFRFVMAGIFLALSMLLWDSISMPDSDISWNDFETYVLPSGKISSILIDNSGLATITMIEPVKVPHRKAALFTKPAETATTAVPPIEEATTAATNAPSEVEAAVAAEAVAAATAATEPAESTEAHADKIAATVEEHKESTDPASQMSFRESRVFHIRVSSPESFEKKLENAQLELGVKRKDFVNVIIGPPPSALSKIAFDILGILIFAAIVLAIMSRNRGAMGAASKLFGIRKSVGKKFNKENSAVTFKDVAGCDEAKKEIMEFVEFLKDGEKFKRLGAKIPKGALLSGPPGTGKTLLAKATAGEAHVPFYFASGSDFVEMYVGLGSSRVRELFKEAKKNAPCIIFIDEIDAIGRKRGQGGVSNDERENTLNQLLVEMDGFDSNSNVVLLAGTNRADVLDQALLRPGRFDRQIVVDKPDIKGRKDIFMVHLKKIVIGGSVDSFASRLSALTPGFSGADIATLCNEAAMVAARLNKNQVDMTDFEAAVDRVIAGQETKKIMSPEEKNIIAYHEAGHAIAGWFLQHADPLLKVTIVPRGSGALGFAQYLPKELYLRNEEQLLDMICMALAGRASEEIHFGKVTTGASDDLRRITQIVYQMVQIYGMNKKIGQVSFPREGGYGSERLYSEATAEMMDEEVREVVEKAYQRTLNLMREKSKQVEAVAKLLIEKETITNLDVTELVGPRPFEPHKEYAEYLHHGWSNPVDATTESSNAVVGEQSSENKDSSSENSDKK